MPFDVCLEIPKLPDPIELMLPGGMSIKHINLDQLAQPALAPLGPAFKLLDAVMALIDVLTTLADAFVVSPPEKPLPDFPKIAQALSRVADIPPNLAMLAPPMAGPAMIAACLDLLLRSLGQIRSELVHLQQELVSLATTENLARNLDDVRLLNVFECAKHNVEQEAANLGQGMASLGHLLALLAMLGKLAGLNLRVPDLRGVSGKPIGEVLAPLDALIDALKALRTLPVLP